MTGFTESVVEEAALSWLAGLGHSVLHGPDIAAGMPAAERTDQSYRDVFLEGRLRSALTRLNPDLPPEAIEDAYRKITRTDAPSLIERNRALHRLIVDGVAVEYRRADGSIAGAQATVIGFAPDDDRNDWLAINQFTVAEGHHTRRPDIVLFVNGLPLAVLELRTRRTTTPRCGAPIDSCRHTRRRSLPCSRRTPCSSRPTACRLASAR